METKSTTKKTRINMFDVVKKEQEEELVLDEEEGD